MIIQRYLCCLLLGSPGSKVVETRRRLSPNRRSCDPAIWHTTHRQLLDSTDSTCRYSGGRSLRTSNGPLCQQSLNVACRMCLNRGEGKTQPYLFHFLRRSRCLPLFHRLSVFLFLSFLESTNIAETQRNASPNFHARMLACSLPPAWALSEHRASSPTLPRQAVTLLRRC